MQHAALRIVLIATLEVIFGVDGHIARRHIDILIVRDIHTGGVVHFIIGTRSDGERRHCPLAMIEDGIHIRWEHTLIGIVHLNSRIRPPKEGLRQIGAVAHTSLNLEIGTA